MKQQLFLVLLIFSATPMFSQDNSLYQKHWFMQNGDTMPYRILFPKGYNSAGKYPVVFFLHGRGESGNDNEKQLIHGSSLFLRDSIREKYPAIVIFPQCGVKTYWSNVVNISTGSSTGKRTFYFIEDGEPSPAMKLLLSLVDHVLTQYPVNRQHVYVGGLSMGGMGTFELVRRKPKTFAAAFAICGGANPATAKKLKNTKWWLFHGLKDEVVQPVYTQQMEAALKKVGAKVRATYYPDVNHNSWDPAFSEPGFMQWLFSNKFR